MARLMADLIIELIIFNWYLLNASLSIRRGVWMLIPRPGVATASYSNSPDSLGLGETVG
jgi:hypothetical protein